MFTKSPKKSIPKTLCPHLPPVPSSHDYLAINKIDGIHSGHRTDKMCDHLHLSNSASSPRSLSQRTKPPGRNKNNLTLTANLRKVRPKHTVQDLYNVFNNFSVVYIWARYSLFTVDIFLQESLHLLPL